MSKIRSFTYNNGSAIGDNSQLGDLAIGRLGQRYDNNPGGKIWWGSPDEGLTYYIAKDVPTSNWPTPVGNNGSVKFWGFERYNGPGTGPANADVENFLKYSSYIAGQTFTNTSASGQWLYDNGYYTNYPYPVETWDTITGYNNPPSYLGTDGVWGTVYGSTNEELYFFWSQFFTSNEPNSPEVATAEYNGGNGGQDYSYSGSLPSTGSNINIRSTGLVIDNINNYLYTTNEAALNSLNRYNLTNKTITHSTRSYYSSDYPMLALDVTNDRLYNIRYNSGYKIEMYTASVLENFGFIQPPNQVSGPIGTSINTNNGNLLTLTQDYFVNYNATNITGSIFTGGDKPQYVTSASIGFDLYLPHILTPGIDPDFRYSVAFVPSENSWYVRGNTDTGTYVEGKLIKCTNDNQITIKDLNFITYTPSNGKMPMHIVYDSVRNLLWMFEYPGSLIGVDPSNLNIEVQHSIITSPTDYIEYNPYLALDETNGVLFTSSKTRGPDRQINVINLQEIYPI